MKDIMLEIIDYYQMMDVTEVIMLPRYQFSIALFCRYAVFKFD